MSNAAMKSKATTPAFQTDELVRDLIAAMPIVIFANALRSALQSFSVRATLQTAGR